MTDKMPKTDRLAGLTEEEGKFRDIVQLLIEDHGNVAMKKNDYPKVIDAFKSLIAARASAERKRALLERSHSFIRWLNEQTAWQTMSPHRDIGTLVKAIAAELAGTEGGNDFDPDNIPDLPEPDRSVSIDELENLEEES